MPPSFSQEQHQIIIGSLLGDGCVFKYKSTHTPYFCVVRKATDDQYLNWEYERMKDFCISAPKYVDTFDKRTNQIYKSVKFMTRRLSLLDDYYNAWYSNNKKIVPYNIELSPLSLAIWFCDDGSISTSNVPWRMRIKLATHGFDDEYVEFLQNILQKRYKEKFPIAHDTNDNGNTHLFITGSDNATRAFIKEIDPVFPNSMMRKAYWKNPDARFYENQPSRTATWRTKL